MVKIRLARHGSKKRPFYRIVAADSRFSRDGRHIQRLGYYNPCAHGAETPLLLDQERLDYWLSQGAQPTERVKKLIKMNQAAATKPIETRPSRNAMKKSQAEAMQVKLQKAKKAEADAAAKAAAEEAKSAEESSDNADTSDS